GCCEISRTAAGYGTVRGPTGFADPAGRRGGRPGRMRRNDRASRKPACAGARTDQTWQSRWMANRNDAKPTELVESHEPYRQAALRILPGRSLSGASYGAA